MNRETTLPLDVLMAASLYLMTRYAEEKRPETAVALARHRQRVRLMRARVADAKQQPKVKGWRRIQ